MIPPEYFKDSELACKCGCGLMPPKRSVIKLYGYRIIMNVKMIITSAARCKAYNFERFGDKANPNSMHLPYHEREQPLGDPDDAAFDIVYQSPEYHRVYEYKAIQLAPVAGFTGIGIKNNNFMHLDTGNPDTHNHRPAVWDY